MPYNRRDEERERRERERRERERRERERRERERRERERRDRERRDSGQVAIEYLGFLPILLAVALAAVQLGLIAYTAQQAGTAARTGARSASLDGPYAQDCQNAVSDWLADGTSCSSAESGEEVTVTASITIPSVIPGKADFGKAEKAATMPLDH